MKLNIKKYLSVTMVLTLLVSLLACAPVNAASHTTPFMYCDFNDGETVNAFFSSAANNNVTDSIVDGFGGSAGAFQRSVNLNTAPAAYLIPVSDSFAPELFSGKIRVSFWFKIDPTVGTLLPASNLSTFHPRFYVKSGSGANKELQANTYTKTGWDNAALNRGEWVFIEMTSNADGKFAGYTLQSADDIGLQFRFNGVSNTANRGWTNTNCISYTIDDFKIEKVVDAYNSTTTYAYPWAENLAITGSVIEDSTVTLSYDYGNNVPENAEGTSYIRVLRETAAGSNKFAVIKEFTGNASESFDYTITQDWVGKKLKMEVVPVDANEMYGASYTKVIGPVAKAFEASSQIGEFTPIHDAVTDTYTYSITGTTSIINNKADGSNLYAILIVALMDAENEIVKWQSHAVVVENTSSAAATATATTGNCSVTVTAAEYEKTARAECYLWDCGFETLPTVYNTNMKELATTKIKTK